MYVLVITLDWYFLLLLTCVNEINKNLYIFKRKYDLYNEQNFQPKMVDTMRWDAMYVFHFTLNSTHCKAYFFFSCWQVAYVMLCNLQLHLHVFLKVIDFTVQYIENILSPITVSLAINITNELIRYLSESQICCQERWVSS